MNHYCTYFDRGYLAQGVALWQSLSRQDPDARLCVLALDADAACILRELQDARMAVVELGKLLESDLALANIRETRPRSEFIFALTPCLIRHLLSGGAGIERIMYLDADLYFFGSPAAIWDEFRDGSIYIVPHRFPAWHDDAAHYGRFNVGVVGFRHDPAGMACIAWWRERCLESTSLDADGARYGDQKYLDEWPVRFSGVVESRHPGVNAAPWNWSAHRWTSEPSAGAPQVDGQPLIVFHFAQFKRISASWFDSGQLEYGVMPRWLRTRLYGEYAAALESAEQSVRRVDPDFAMARRGWGASLGPWHLAALRLFWGQYWWRSGAQLWSGRAGLGRWSGKIMGKYRRWQRRHR